MIKGILFDMDGTLVNSELYYTSGTYNWMKEKGYQGSFESVFCIIGRTLEDTYDILSTMIPYTPKEIEKFNTEYFVTHPIDYKKYGFKDTVETINSLYDLGIKMAICSGSPKSDIENFMRENNITDKIDYYITSEECKNAKPDPEIYLTALSHIGLNKNEVIIVEDSNSGIQAGINAGIKVIARKDEQFSLDQSKAKFLITDLRELIQIVKED